LDNAVNLDNLAGDVFVLARDAFLLAWDTFVLAGDAFILARDAFVLAGDALVLVAVDGLFLVNAVAVASLEGSLAFVLLFNFAVLAIDFVLLPINFVLLTTSIVCCKAYTPVIAQASLANLWRMGPPGFSDAALLTNPPTINYLDDEDTTM
jgi:hypothetical protein